MKNPESIEISINKRTVCDGYICIQVFEKGFRLQVKPGSNEDMACVDITRQELVELSLAIKRFLK